jgi:hypothetical protein
MKKASCLPLIALVAYALSGCASDDDFWKSSRERNEEEVRRNIESNRREHEREEAEFRRYLDNFAERIGKAMWDLTSRDRANARRAFEREHGREYHYYVIPWPVRRVS